MGRTFAPFIRGELIDLCVPSEAAIEAGWTDWFNDPKTTRFLGGQGAFPNSPTQQAEFLKSLSGGSRLALMICDPEGEKLWGTISLSSIDWMTRSAQIALVLPDAPKRPALAALEAMARLTEHAFTTMGLEKVWAGQAYPGLAKWNQRLELLGYRTDGILRRGFVKGRTVSDAVTISVLYEDYCRIQQHGGYWPGAETTLKRLRRLPKVSLAERIAAVIQQEQEAHLAEMGEVWRAGEDSSPGLGLDGYELAFDAAGR